MKQKKLLTFLTVLGFSLFYAPAQGSAVSLQYKGDGGYSLVERTNLRRYVNGKYVGLTSREVRSFVSPSEPPLKRFKAKGSAFENDQWYDGSFYVMEETLRNNQAAGAQIHEAVQSVFHISENGHLTMYKDNGYPSFRSFPAYTQDKITAGDSWKAQAERSVDPLNKGVFTKIPMLVAYSFAGEETYKEQKVYRIKAQWQTYYGANNRDFGGDSTLDKARGGHKADIIVLKATGVPVLVIDNVDETFFWTDGTQVNFKGTITLFTEFPPALDTQKIMHALNRVASVKTTAKESKQSKSADTAKQAVESAAGKNTESEAAFAENAKTKVEADAALAKKTKTETEVALAEKTTAQNENSGYEKFDGALAKSDLADFTDKAVERGEKVPEEILDSGSLSGGGTLAAGGSLKGSDKVIEKVSDEEKEPPKNNIIAEEVPAGIRLSIRDIKFVPDSAQVLPGESERLDEIAKVLKLAPDSQFLVEGHTASVGKPAGEQKLSEQRAHQIAEELKKRGVNAVFICRGWGGTKPVASNNTDKGRAQNRRVEITILK